MLIMNMMVILIIVLLGKDFEFIITTAGFTGCVTRYNSTIKKIGVAYEDGTDDYFAENDIDGVEIIDY